MNIGFSFIDLAPGGAQHLLVELALELSDRGHQITIFIKSQPGDFYHVDPGMLTSLQRAGVIIGNPEGLRSCQVIQLDGYHSLRQKIPYLRTYNKCVETYHSRYSVKRSGPVYAPHRIAVSSYVQSFLPAPTFIIPNGIIQPVTLIDEKKEFDVAILGRIHPVKRQDFFLQVCQELSTKRSEMSCLIIGGYSENREYREKITGQVSLLQAQNIHVHITGFVPRETVYSWLSKTRILLITSQDEGFGRMAIEAMACGVPVIANPVGGLIELIDHGKTGYLANRDEIRSFVDLADHLLNTPSLCQEIGARAKDKVSNSFTLDKIATKYLNYYQSVIPGAI
jgi:glycosyltransferase involved in cell wall biosynthesis